MAYSLQIKKIFRPFYQQVRFFIYKCRYLKKSPQILSVEKTLELIINNDFSISRYGDGELNIMNGGSIGFCHQNHTLCHHLQDVFQIPINKHLVCIPPMILSLKGLMPRPKAYWKNLLAAEYPLWYKFIKPKHLYGNAFVSRFYMDFQNVEKAKRIIDLWRRVWNQKECIIVEGSNTRMGMGNDLFNNAKKISRILCPPVDSYTRYPEIIASIKQHYSGQLILIALGPVATVLAYDLCKIGVQALDIGHLDIEYEWFLRRATQKINISTKAVNECQNGGLNVSNEVTDSYLSQIIDEIS